MFITILHLIAFSGWKQWKTYQYTLLVTGCLFGIVYVPKKSNMSRTTQSWMGRGRGEGWGRGLWERNGGSPSTWNNLIDGGLQRASQVVCWPALRLMNRTHINNACTGGEINIDFWHPKSKNVQASMRQIGVGQVVEWVGRGGVWWRRGKLYLHPKQNICVPQ